MIVLQWESDNCGTARFVELPHDYQIMELLVLQDFIKTIISEVFSKWRPISRANQQTGSRT
jgi:hypothetical protein